MTRSPVIGIVGSNGAYGRWLQAFFVHRMGLTVVGTDPTLAGAPSDSEMIARCDVLVFAVPIRHAAAVIEGYAAIADERVREQLWIDVTWIKSAPVAAMLRSQAEVLGLHPMTAPPKSPTLQGRVLVVCRSRIDGWQPWADTLLGALQAECVDATPGHHDRVMAVVQAMVHATHLAQAGVLREYAGQLGDLQALLPYRTASFEMDTAIAARILALNPAIYEDIQFGNPHVLPVLDTLLRQLSELRTMVAAGGEQARASFRQRMLAENREAIGAQGLAQGNYRFERIGYLLADLSQARSVSIHLPEDRPGSLRALLQVFEQHGLNIESLHSSRTQAGEVHFRFGLPAQTDQQALDAALAQVCDDNLGRILAADA